MSATVSVSGETDAANALDRMGSRMIEQRAPMAASARTAARSIRGIPVRTGALDRSVRSGARSDGHGFTIESDVPYARFVFGGTRNMRARPPQVPPGVGPATARASLRWIVG